MPNTYTQLHVQIVFAVKGRQNLIPAIHRSLLHQYITSVLQKDNHKLLAIFCMPDHIHFLAGINPDIAISDMVLNVKRASTNFINDEKLMASHFNWQRGYGAFAYTKSHVPGVIMASHFNWQRGYGAFAYTKSHVPGVIMASHFNWQRGYGAFAYTKSHVPGVIIVGKG